MYVFASALYYQFCKTLRKVSNLINRYLQIKKRTEIKTFKFATNNKL